MGCGSRAVGRDPLPARPGPDAGLHRRAGRGRPRRDARRDRRDRRRPDRDQPAGRRRPGDRPLGPGRCLRQRHGLRGQRRARVRAQPGALRVPQVGPEVLRQLQSRTAGHRHLSPGEPRVHRPGRLQPRARRPPVCLSRHAGRDRLTYDDGQRTRSARLGRRRDRGRSGHARSADLDAAAAGGRIPALRQAAGRRYGHRSGPDRDRDAARARGRLQVRRVLRPRPADPAAGRPRHARQHVARVRLHLRDLPARRRDAQVPRADRQADRDDRAGRRLCARAGHVPHRRFGRARLQRHSRTRARFGRAVDRRPEAAPGPGLAVRREARLPRVAGRVRQRRRRRVEPAR